MTMKQAMLCLLIAAVSAELSNFHNLKCPDDYVKYCAGEAWALTCDAPCYCEDKSTNLMGSAYREPEDPRPFSCGPDGQKICLLPPCDSHEECESYCSCPTNIKYYAAGETCRLP